MKDILGILNGLKFNAWKGLEQMSDERGYPLYAKAAAEIKPRSILEIGAFQGHGLISFLLGYDTSKVDWVDCEAYIKGTNQHCVENLTSVHKDVVYRFWTSLEDAPSDEMWDLIHVDAEHSYEGAIRDMEWAWPRTRKVMLVDDINYDIMPQIRKAVEDFAEKYNLEFEEWTTLRGWAVFSKLKRPMPKDL